MRALDRFPGVESALCRTVFAALCVAATLVNVNAEPPSSSVGPCSAGGPCSFTIGYDKSVPQWTLEYSNYPQHVNSGQLTWTVANTSEQVVDVKLSNFFLHQCKANSSTPDAGIRHCPGKLAPLDPDDPDQCTGLAQFNDANDHAKRNIVLTQPHGHTGDCYEFSVAVFQDKKEVARWDPELQLDDRMKSYVDDGGVGGGGVGGGGLRTYGLAPVLIAGAGLLIGAALAMLMMGAFRRR